MFFKICETLFLYVNIFVTVIKKKILSSYIVWFL